VDKPCNENDIVVVKTCPERSEAFEAPSVHALGAAVCSPHAAAVALRWEPGPACRVYIGRAAGIQGPRDAGPSTAYDRQPPVVEAQPCRDGRHSC
jgi:hypothetical protein